MAQGAVRLRVPELLKAKGWSISELMRRSGLSYPTVYRLAKKDPFGIVSLETAVKIAKAFDVPLEEVIEGVAPDSG
jgi:transcriptional regulator with XRE-family HTH domain